MSRYKIKTFTSSRDSALVIAHPLSHIVNLSIIQGAVPNDLKSAQVVPLFKNKKK